MCYTGEKQFKITFRRTHFVLQLKFKIKFAWIKVFFYINTNIGTDFILGELFNIFMNKTQVFYND